MKNFKIITESLIGSTSDGIECKNLERFIQDEWKIINSFRQSDTAVSFVIEKNIRTKEENEKQARFLSQL